MRSRNIVTRSGKRFRGKYPSLKLKRTVHWESILERDAIILFEFHPLVTRYQEQPSEEHYYDESGAMHTCYPDFLLTFAGGSELLVEVKPARKLRDLAVRRKLDLIAKRFAEQCRAYRVLTDEDIRRQPLFDNLLRLRAAQHIGRTHWAAIVDSACSLSTAILSPLGEWSAKLGGEDAALSLVADGTLRMNLELPITPLSSAWTIHHKEAGHGAFHI